MSWRRGATPNRAKWAKVRLLVLDRDGWACVQCGKAGRLEVDHRVPLEDGGALYDPGNLQSLCRGCHIDKTSGENQVKPTPLEVKAWQAYLVAQIANKG